MATPSQTEHGLSEEVEQAAAPDDAKPSETSGSSEESSSAAAEGKNRTTGRKGATNGRELGVWESSFEDRANCLSIWSFSYLSPLLRLGAHKVLDPDDIGVPSRRDVAANAYDKALAMWSKMSLQCREKNKVLKAAYEEKLARCTTEDQRARILEPVYQEPSIAWALIRSYGITPLVLALVYYVISALLIFVPVIILNDLVRFFQSGLAVNEWDGIAHPWIQVAGLGIVPVLVSLLQTRHTAIYAHCAVFVRTSVSTMLYRKALHVSAAGRAKTSTGQVVNMMSNDTAQLQRFLQFVGMTIVAPLQIIIALILIFRQVGNATWVGVGFMIFLIPINTIIFSIVAKQRREVLKYSDLRVKMMNEILAGIRIIKFYAWERPFGKEVGGLRSNELAALTRLAYTSAIGFSLILMSAPIIQPILVFLTFVQIQSEPLDPATAFTTVALFNIMRFPFAFLPMGLLQYIQSRIALKRLERYLDLPELSKYVESSYPPDSTELDDPKRQLGSISICDGTFAWVDPDAKPIRDIQEDPKKMKKDSKKKSSDGESESDMRSSAHSGVSSTVSDCTPKGPTVTLQDLNFTIEAGSLVAVVGIVGSGKSSLLSAILGELEPIGDSKVYIPRDKDASSGCISYCSQSPWVVNDTLRGNVLFGRTFDDERYNKVVEASALRDDFSALPAGDMTEIGERGINLSGGQKARVSLARALYSSDTRVVLLDDPLSAVDAHVGEHIFEKAIKGEMSQGITRVLVTHHVHLLNRCDSVIVMEGGRIKHHGTYDDLIRQGVTFAGAVDVSKAKSGDTKQASEGKESSVHDEKLSTKAEAKLKENGKTLVKDEEREEGAVEGSAYMHYARAGGLCVAAFTFIVQGIGRASEIMSGFWLALWAEKSFAASLSGNPMSDAKTNFYVGIYAVFGMVGVLGLTFRAILIAMHRLRASKLLHNDLTNTVLRAPVAFFDVTPTGRILNRFAADMDKVDLELTQSLSQGIATIFNVLGAIGAMVAATRGIFLAPLIPIGYAYYLIQKWFRKTSTELQRITSIANSPIFADFSQILTGTSTIRAYGEEQRFFRQCNSSFDIMNASFILLELTNCWLSLRLDVLGGAMGAFIGGIAVATSESGFISAGWLGLALTYSIEVTTYLKHGVRMIATIEAQMNSVERILFYTNKIETEPPEFTDKDPSPEKWPSSGAIEFRDVSMRYRDGPLVLKDVSIKIYPGERIGVCGRTGSGKSSLMIALFRITDIEHNPDHDGLVLIDDVNISDIGTTTLRQNLSIIPQEPIIFSNTVRYNLDPFGTCTDDELWDVLKKVQMADFIAGLTGCLLEELKESSSFSLGQMQLLCIARSLLRKPRILVMDEATASIDNETDAAIQKMIRENFNDATVLTIAHRLNTILDSDRVLVMDDGRVAEFDTPENLLQTDGSLFKAMIDKSRAVKGEIQDE